MIDPNEPGFFTYLVIVLAVGLAILWIALPLAVFGIKSKLLDMLDRTDELVKELRESRYELRAIRQLLEKQSKD